MKVRPLIESYVDLWEALRPRRVVELGIRKGGSTAMLHELGGAERIVSIELSNVRIEALDRYISERGAQDTVHPWYGVNQADRERLTAIVTDEFAGTPLDLVIDDASHLYRESRASFEVLFPRLRPGGLYLLEDWRWQHLFASELASALEVNHSMQSELARRLSDVGGTTKELPMSRLVLELVIARAISGEVVAEVTVGPDWTAVRRGPAPLDPAGFRLDEVAPDHLQVLASIG